MIKSLRRIALCKIIHCSLADFESNQHDDYPVAIRIADNINLLQHSVQKALTYMVIFPDCNRGEPNYPQPHQLEMIVDALKLAKHGDMNVVVHCVMGISRSTAIAQVAIDFLGFEDPAYDHSVPYGEFVVTNRPHINKDIYNDLRKLIGESWEKGDSVDV